MGQSEVKWNLSPRRQTSQTRLIGRTRNPLTSVVVSSNFRLRVEWKRKVGGGILAVVGFMLSPLSWWNDLFVNVPIALVFAWIVSFFYRPAFEVSLIVGYWATNVLGFVLMHKGAQKMLTEKDKPYSRRDFFRDVGVSLLYTGLIVALLKLGVLKPLQSYLP